MVGRKPDLNTKHPKIGMMVKDAITTLKEKKGSSLSTIKKYISRKYGLNGSKIAGMIKISLSKSIHRGEVTLVQNAGAPSSFKIRNPEFKNVQQRTSRVPSGLVNRSKGLYGPGFVNKKDVRPKGHVRQMMSKVKCGPTAKQTLNPFHSTSTRQQYRPCRLPKQEHQRNIHGFVQTQRVPQFLNNRHLMKGCQYSSRKSERSRTKSVRVGTDDDGQYDQAYLFNIRVSPDNHIVCRAVVSDPQEEEPDIAQVRWIVKLCDRTRTLMSFNGDAQIMAEVNRVSNPGNTMILGFILFKDNMGCHRNNTVKLVIGITWGKLP